MGPGTILQIVGLPSEQAPLKGLMAEPADFRNCMPVWPDVEAHLPINYVWGLLRLLNSELRRRQHVADKCATDNLSRDNPFDSDCSSRMSADGFLNSSEASNVHP